LDKKARQAIDDLLISFADWLKSQGKAEGTLQTYLRVIRIFLGFIWQKDFRVEDISSDHVQSYIHYLETNKKSPGTVEKHFAAISVFSKFLGNHQMMMNIVRIPKEKHDDMPESLSPAEQKKLLDEVKADGNLRNIAIIYTLLHTGIRVSELCDLNKSDIFLNDDQGYLIVRPVNSKEGREIPLSHEVRKYLSRLIESPKNQGPALFVSTVNKRLTPRAVQYILKKYNVHPHKLRHTFCQRLINNGIDLQTVSKLAGHKDINVTKRYSKEIDIDVKSAIEKTFT